MTEYGKPRFPVWAGIDVDTKSVAFAVVGDNDELWCCRSYVLPSKKQKEPLHIRIRILMAYLEDFAVSFKSYDVHQKLNLVWCGVEQPVGHIFSAVMVALAAGAAAQVVSDMLGVDYQFFYPQAGKTAITGEGRPDKESVVKMANMRWEGLENDHEAHAIGMALAMRKECKEQELAQRISL